MSLFAIFGSGFGLYGYLPALVSCGQRIVLPKRYRARFCERPELFSHASSVEWEEDEHTLLNRATGAVFALQPENQYRLLPSCLKNDKINHFLLEKPLAHSPKNAAILLDTLIRSGKTFRIGYIFRYTIWGKQLLTALSTFNQVSSLSIQWHFMAHHFRQDLQTWKLSHSAGGGIIRFYGIQMIALLAEIGYCQVTLSQTIGLSIDECEKWHAVFTGYGLPECEVQIDSRSRMNRFQIRQQSRSTKDKDKTTFIDLSDPFDVSSKMESLSSVDQRVPLLNQLCRSLWKPSVQVYEWYAAANQLWQAVEDKTLFSDKTSISA